MFGVLLLLTVRLQLQGTLKEALIKVACLQATGDTEPPPMRPHPCLMQAVILAMEPKAQQRVLRYVAGSAFVACPHSVLKCRF